MFVCLFVCLLVSNSENIFTGNMTTSLDTRREKMDIEMKEDVAHEYEDVAHEYEVPLKMTECEACATLPYKP